MMLTGSIVIPLYETLFVILEIFQAVLHIGFTHFLLNLFLSI